MCRAVEAGRDVLLVMPTGAGKSLCYQLPGLARGGTTLVISPLIALMEDQVGQLLARGLRAERIHSGRDRGASRAACVRYLDGALDFLFIAPERLKVPGFPEMLARRKPVLVAIDEAHCISQGGHDFRPEYRMLKERLPLLRPAPIVALTATATPMVQDDIVAELRLEDSLRFIHGFRRTNIGVEVVEKNPGERADVVLELLADPARRPAIVYAPTRKEAEGLARKLAKRNLRAAPYHAGIATRERDEVQSAFLRGERDVIVATIAFGMGVDKPDVRTVLHTGLPGSVEGYYQEIGRAGRDGAPSRAVLLHSFVDTKTHAYFLERDYPPVETLARIASALRDEGIPADDLARRTGIDEEIFDIALQKLVVHGGATVDVDRNARRGPRAWQPGYERQRAHRTDQLDRILRFATTPSCRMLQLVAHFGDRNDDGTPCGLCDVCAPSASVAHAFRAPSDAERVAARKILAALRKRDGLAVGQIHRDVLGEKTVDRRMLEHVVGALARAGLVRVTTDTFDKGGERISFRRVHLAAGGAPDLLDDAPLSMEEEPKRRPSTRRKGKRRRSRR